MNEDIKKIEFLLNRMKFYFRENEWKTIHITSDEAETIIGALETKKALLTKLEDDGR
jgi:hypothetical protein